VRRMPRWLLWSLATAGMWAAWAVLVFMPLRAREARVDGALTDLAARMSDQMRRIGVAPAIVVQIDSSKAQLAEARQSMPSADDVNAFLTRLSSLGRESGMSRVAAAPVLASMMGLRSGGVGTDGAALGLDTLIVELTGAGRFRTVGQWLDRIETEPAFRGWESCRWDQGESDGVVSFSGRVAFLVVIDHGRPS
jgi:hypothetical protein